MNRLIRPFTALLAVGAITVTGLSLWAQANELSPADRYAASYAAAKPGHLVWNDEFSGKEGAAPDPEHWNLETGGQGWGNQEVQCYTTSRKNSALNGSGQLLIMSRYAKGYACADGEVRDYTSARLNTDDLVLPQYGLIEIRAKVPPAAGTWPAFWALGATPDTSWPVGGEFDILESLGRTPGVVRATVHSATRSGEHFQVAKEQQMTNPADAAWAADFHTYGVRWSATEFVYYVDGVRWATVTRKELDKASDNSKSWVFTKPFYLVLNLALGGDFAGPMETREKQTFTVDYVRIYK